MTTEEIIHVYENSQLVTEFFTEEAVTQAYVEGLATLRAQQERENPKPLTRDELRGMVGEPVYISNMGESFGLLGGWAVIEEISDNLVSIQGGGWFTFRGYGQTWLAYRYKPQEAQP